MLEVHSPVDNDAIGISIKILKVGLGRSEFINHCGAKERWALDFDPGTKNMRLIV